MTTKADIKMPPRVSIESKLLKGVAYHPESQTLEVEFNGNGKVYRYHGVPEEKFQQMMAAKSVGSHFLFHVKNAHDFTRHDK